LQQLTELPYAAIEALIESDDLRVVSENTALAAVSYWLEQEDRRQSLTADQIQGLANKLRLCHCTRWYLTGHLMDTKGWLYGALTYQQRIMILGSMSDPGVWESFLSGNPVSCKEVLFQGHANAVGDVRWWKKARSKRKPTLYCFKNTLGELWAQDDYYLGEVFSNGLVLDFGAMILRADEDTSSDGTSSDSESSYVVEAAVSHTDQHAPVAYTACVSLVALEPQDTITEVFQVHDFQAESGWISRCLGNLTFTSLASAPTALQPFIQPDGKLHIKVSIEVK
jgi:hypothetical protein